MRASPKYWSPEDLEYLRNHYEKTPTPDLAKYFNRSEDAVRSKAALLGVNKDLDVTNSALSRVRKGVRLSPLTEFKPGNVPHNRGVRKPGYAPGRMGETQFKKGTLAGFALKNHCPIGTIRPDAYGYLRIKVREALPGEVTGFGNSKAWPQYHRYLWVEKHGPIPKGHIVIFKDGDSSNCTIDNLECVHRSELMRRNTMWKKYPPEVIKMIQEVAWFNRKLKKYAKEQNDGSSQPPVRDSGSSERPGQPDGHKEG